VNPIEFRGKHAEILADWTTAELCAEGALSCGKTTVALWKELEALKRWPGIWIFLARWTNDATTTLLQPAFEQLARIHGTTWTWDRDENCYGFENGSRAFSFGLKTQSQDPTERYGKIRGLPVSRIYIDQAEQIPADIAAELRLRLRPDIEARQRGDRFPFQLTFTPNPVHPQNHWIAKDFPLNNKIKGRRHWTISLFDNRHNLPPELIESAERTYPPEHPKHKTVILGERGLNVMGDPVYDQQYDRALHVRPVQARTDAPLIEAFEFGQHNPTWIIAQRTYHGGLIVLGGLMGMRLMQEDFLPLVKQYRQEWYPDLPIKTCTAPMGETQKTVSGRYTLLGLLRQAGFSAVWREHANAPDVKLAMIEEIAALLRRRTGVREEALSINADPSRWLRAAPDGSIKPEPFLSFAFDGGYVWSEHTVSISNKEVRQPHNDDEYANAMRCLENLILNFCAGQASQDARDRQRSKAQARSHATDVAEGPHGWMAH
jgi:hypothetical protein